jgi:SHS2 domain-containing protein
LLVKITSISFISEYALSAVVKFETFVPGHHLIKSELKAVTYHQISVEQEETKWKARIIFDV